MASTLLLWIYLLPLFWRCVRPGLRRNRHCGTSFVVHRQQAWLRSTIALTVQLSVAFPPIPGTSALYWCSMEFLGSTKGAGYLGERRVLPLENYGEEVS